MALIMVFIFIMRDYAYAPIKPNVLYKYTGFDVVFSSPKKGVPTVNSTMFGTFWTNDVFAAENPFVEEISMVTNVTNLLNYYCCLVLFDEGADPAYLTLHAASNSTNNEGYNAPIRAVQFNLSGPVRYALVQGPLWFSNYSSFPQNATPPLTLGDASGMFNIQFQRTTTQLTWIVIAFGIFLLQPIAEALWGLEETPQSNREQEKRGIMQTLRWWLRRSWWAIQQRMNTVRPAKE